MTLKRIAFYSLAGGVQGALGAAACMEKGGSLEATAMDLFVRGAIGGAVSSLLVSPVFGWLEAQPLSPVKRQAVEVASWLTHVSGVEVGNVFGHFMGLAPIPASKALWGGAFGIMLGTGICNRLAGDPRLGRLAALARMVSTMAAPSALA